MSKKISIITPSYNQGQFIEDAIQSVLNQGYSNFEHIIIDGRSSDNTVKILRKYQHLRWISESDEGQGDAINKGFKMASGDIIGWLNADDYYLPDVFNKVSKELENNSLIDGVYSNYKFVDRTGEITREIITHPPVKWLSLFQCFIPSTTFFFKRKILDQNILIDNDFHIVMDKEFFAHILYEDFTLKYMDEFFAHFRWHENNKSINSKLVKKIRLKEGKRIFSRYSEDRILKGMMSKNLYKYLMYICSIYRIFLKKRG